MNQTLKALALDAGAAAVGFAGVDRLTDKPSMDAGYSLPGARSIISVMMPLDGQIIRDYLGKKNRENLQRHETDTYRRLYAIGEQQTAFLRSRGHRAVVAEPNLDYRYKDQPGHKRVPHAIRQTIADWFATDSPAPVQWIKNRIVRPLYESSFRHVDWNLTPSFSHRYGAIAAGIGAVGWSGNVLHPDFGARVLYNTVITDAQLPPDPMIAESPCDGCRICTRVCQSNFIHPKQAATVTIGGRTFEHNRKAHNLRCIFVCAGLSGQNKHKGWSTWSRGRITLPEADDDLETFWKSFVFEKLGSDNYYSRVLANLTYHSELGFIRKTEERFDTTCGNCQLVCWKTRSERKENYEILVNGGSVTMVN